MRLTSRQLNRATLARQLLLERHPIAVVDAVRRVVALQAQEPASPYLALWNRVADFDPSDLDEVFARHEVVKATLMRITLHAVVVDDYPAFHAAMLPNLRASRLGDRRFLDTGLTAQDVDALVSHLVAFAAETRSKDEIEAHLEEALGEPPDTRVWWALRTFAPLIHGPTGGPWSFGSRPSFRAAPIDPAAHEREVGLDVLVRRYLEGFGPATVADVAQFSLQQRGAVRAALQRLGDRVVMHEGPDGAELFDVPDGALPDEDVPAPPRLLGMWESSLLAYFDRSRIIPEQHRSVAVRRNGDVLPTVLVDGYVAGLWRVVDDGIEVRAFDDFTEPVWGALATEASALQSLVAGRDPTVYGRYGHWWGKLPEGGRTRVLGG